MQVKATILLPTTKERSPLLPYSVGSILQQTIREIEIFIIGDGVDEPTRAVIHDLMKSDNRIHFFDHPKGPRRGEPYRHQALMEHAQGEIVCYLLDRDLMLPNHVERMYENLKAYNFCVHTSLDMREDGHIHYVRKSFLGDHQSRLSPTPPAVLKAGFLFSQVGHTLAFYKSLPYGWRITPTLYPTDVYMWRQFMVHDELNLTSTTDATILYFKRQDHPGWPASERARELKQFHPMLSAAQGIQELEKMALLNLMLERNALCSAWFMIKGQPISRLPARVFNKLKKPFVKRW